MDMQEKTQQMVNEAVAEAVEHLKQFETAIKGLEGEERMERGRDWLWENKEPIVWPKCVKCGKTMWGYPLVFDKEDKYLISEPLADFTCYFNGLVSLRTCHHCGNRHPKL